MRVRGPGPQPPRDEAVTSYRLAIPQPLVHLTDDSHSHGAASPRPRTKRWMESSRRTASPIETNEARGLGLHLSAPGPGSASGDTGARGVLLLLGCFERSRFSRQCCQRTGAKDPGTCQVCG